MTSGGYDPDLRRRRRTRATRAADDFHEGQGSARCRQGAWRRARQSQSPELAVSALPEIRSALDHADGDAIDEDTEGYIEFSQRVLTDPWSEPAARQAWRRWAVYRAKSSRALHSSESAG